MFNFSLQKSFTRFLALFLVLSTLSIQTSPVFAQEYPPEIPVVTLDPKEEVFEQNEPPLRLLFPP